MKKIIGIICIIFSLFIILYVMYMNSNTGQKTRTFSSYTLISSSWDRYKKLFINQDGRVIDYSQNSVTTSEGQSYALLRSVWIDDKATFDLTWKWTRENLKRPNDQLFGWRWGKNEKGKFGFIIAGGSNSASDADSDIALALLFAGKRWGDPNYTTAAKAIIADIWKNEVWFVKGRPYLTAGNWAKSSSEIIINPSYFAPYAWRIFAKVDKTHDWNSLIKPAYELLIEAGKSPLDTPRGSGLPPDWLSLKIADGSINASKLPNITTNFSYDAVRVPWRIALDYQWNNEPMAKEYLSTLSVLSQKYEENNKLIDNYGHDGAAKSTNENPATYGGTMGYFFIIKPNLAKKIYEDKITNLYSNDKNSFNQNIPYYEQNWLWFGAALYDKFLVPYL